MNALPDYRAIRARFFRPASGIAEPPTPIKPWLDPELMSFPQSSNGGKPRKAEGVLQPKHKKGARKSRSKLAATRWESGVDHVVVRGDGVIRDILYAVALKHGMGVMCVTGDSREQKFIRVRYEFCYRARMAGFSYHKIAAAISRNHATATHGFDVFSRWLEQGEVAL